MPLSKEDLLLEDYKTSLELYMHEGHRKANLFTMFFLIQGGLFTIFGWLFSTSRPLAIMLSILAAVFCVLWFLVMERMRAFIGLRVYQLQQIEKELGVMSTATNEQTLRRTGKTEVLGSPYKLSLHQKAFSVNRMESLLPALVAVFWVLIAFGAGLNLL